jgi:DNA repair protein RadC
MRVYEAILKYHVAENNLPSAIVDTPAKAAAYLRSAMETHPVQEGFYVILLTRRNRALGRHLVSLGTLTSALASPREVFRAAILGNAAACLCGHNHPSGDPAPSGADIQLTRQLREASKAIDIPLLDHVICGTVEGDPLGRGYYSFREAGLI